MKFDNLLIEAISKANYYISLFLTLEDNPERILTDVFLSGSDNILTRIIESSEELTGETLEVHDLQDELYKVLIPYLTTYLKGLEVVYDSNNYPAPIQIFEGEREIGRLDIFKQVFTVVPHEDIRREESHLYSLESEFNQNAEQLAKYEGYQLNPSTYAETTKQKLELAFKKAKIKKEINNKFSQLIDLSMELERNFIAQKIRVEKVKEGLESYEDMQNGIANKFRGKYKYEVKRDGE